ncbi:MAG: tetratricopeptide repeat protein, partial [Eubacterium sp.]|nr:tetratricopeptide repeat protein [Eubacterium sp.]
LALLSYDKRKFDKAKEYCERSLILDNNAYNNHLYSAILYQLSDERSVYFAEKCIDINNNSYCLAESILSLLLKQQAYDSVINSFHKLTDDLKQNPRLLMYLSMAYLKSGNAQKAEEILLSDGGLVLLDFREGDKFLDKLYRGIRKELYNECYDEIIVPEQFDFIVADLKTEDKE